ncbi:MAG: V-type ATP synthase subunit E [Treponemataceae bacterium]
MDIQLQELIDKIKKDGIEKSSAEAARSKAEAEAEAKRIVEAAKKEADALVSKAKVDAERFEKAAAAALEQSSRNLILSFKTEIAHLLEIVVKRDTAVAYGEDALKAAVPEVVKAWAAQKGDSLDVLLSADSLAKLESFFTQKLSIELKKGVTLKSDKTVGNGFKIGAKDGSSYYDFSADAVAELLSAYLNPRLAEILKASAKGI